MRSSLWLVVLGSLLLVPLESSGAASPQVAIGEVTTEVARRDVDLGVVLRAMLEQELKSVDMGNRPQPKPTILSVSLVQMDRAQASPSKSLVTVVVSATLRDKKRGAVLAILEGRARAENEDRLVDVLERAALKSAVRGAVSRIPEALDATSVTGK